MQPPRTGHTAMTSQYNGRDRAEVTHTHGQDHGTLALAHTHSR